MFAETLAAFSTLTGFFKSTTELTNAISSAADDSVIKAKVAEVNTQILAAQQSALAAQRDQFTLVDRVRDLEKEIARLEAWDTEKERYHLVPIGAGAFAYSVKRDTQGTDPPHQICANCYQNGRKSILHKEMLSPGRSEILGCQHCGAVIYIRGMYMKEHASRISAYRQGK
jgi:hypothetical protein